MRFIILSLLLLVISDIAVAGGDPVAGKDKVILCIGCHGIDGNSSSSLFPKLAGQVESYLAKQINDFKTGARNEEHMTSMVETIDVSDIPDIAAYFSSQKRKRVGVVNNGTYPGKRLYHTGIKNRGVAACASCHGITALGNPTVKYPALAGQHREYINKALKDFRSGERSNDPQSLMRNIAAKLSDRGIEMLSHYIETLH
ncbi:c-type cytochrome [Sulfuriflexus mobilis]|uniref:c-type cytochrome n=1 Tax=Sulfuriflexus mobilis TaxID=1811807 RepID=UPI0015596FFE|nr:c-type cytochrome [Sulfuriflexus mobilis]